MTATQLHLWLSSPEALATTRHAVFRASTYFPERARFVGLDELESQALVILSECAQPKPQWYERPKCAHCGQVIHLTSAVPGCTQAHIGSMWDWPADQMAECAIQQTAFCLLNYLRSCNFAAEIPNSDEAAA
jgi:hypothetical protein